MTNLVLIACLSLAACGEYVPRTDPAPVLSFGMRTDSATGAILTEEGDTVWNIARRYRLPLRGIIDLNGLEPPYALSAGQRLKLPPPVEYRARQGDTVASIAAMFGVGASRLVAMNRIIPPYLVLPDQVLRIPFLQKQKAVQPVALATAPVIAPAVEKVEADVLSAPHVSSLPRKQASMEKAPEKTVLFSKLTRFIWPVRGRIIGRYGVREGGFFNDGIDIAVPKGTAVAAAADGVVAYVGNSLKSYGNMVLIRHGGGMMTAYAHLDAIRVVKGMALRKGQRIGTAGATGEASVPQVHFEIREGMQSFDPSRYLG